MSIHFLISGLRHINSDSLEFTTKGQTHFNEYCHLTEALCSRLYCVPAHRRSQDFVWGYTFFLKKLRTFLAGGALTNFP